MESRSLLVGDDEEGDAVVALRTHTADEDLGNSAIEFRKEAQQLGYPSFMPVTHYNRGIPHSKTRVRSHTLQ